MLTIAGGILLAALVLFVGRAVFIWIGGGILKCMDWYWDNEVKKSRR